MKRNNLQLIFGLRPVSEAIHAGQEIDKVLIRKGLQGEQFIALFQTIREFGIPYQFVPVEKLNRMTGGNHQGVVAHTSLIEYKSLEEIVQRTFEEGRDPFVLILDGITDVRNFGAIARTAECAGVDTIVVPEKNSVVVTADAIKASAGALSRIAVSRSKDMDSSIGYLKQSGIVVVAASEKAKDNFFDTSLTGPVAVLLGSEGTGIHHELLQKADNSVRIPMHGSIASLNVSVAFGILAYEIIRQRYMQVGQ